MTGVVCGACGALTIGGARHCPNCGLAFRLAQPGLLRPRASNAVRVSLFAMQSLDETRRRKRGWTALLALAFLVFAASTLLSMPRPILSPFNGSSFTGLHGTAASASRAGLNAAAVPSFDGHIALAVRRADGTDVLIARETLRAPRRIVHLAGDVRDLAWSPDGQTLAFTWEQDGTSDIYRISAEGDDLHNLTQAFPVTRETQPSWSPDGHAIAFISDRSTHDDVYTISVDGAQLRQVTDNGTNRRPMWLLDGQLVWVAAHGDTWSLDALPAQGNSMPHTAQSLRTRVPAEATHLISAPAQRQLAFAIQDAQTYQVFTLVSGDEHLTLRAEEPGAVAALAWSPDGTQLLVATAANAAPTLPQLALLNLSDGRTVVLPYDLGEIRGLAWTGV